MKKGMQGVLNGGVSAVHLVYRLSLYSERRKALFGQKWTITLCHLRRPIPLVGL